MNGPIPAGRPYTVSAAKKTASAPNAAPRLRHEVPATPNPSRPIARMIAVGGPIGFESAVEESPQQHENEAATRQVHACTQQARREPCDADHEHDVGVRDRARLGHHR